MTGTIKVSLEVSQGDGFKAVYSIRKLEDVELTGSITVKRKYSTDQNFQDVVLNNFNVPTGNDIVLNRIDENIPVDSVFKPYPPSVNFSEIKFNYNTREVTIPYMGSTTGKETTLDYQVFDSEGNAISEVFTVQIFPKIKNYRLTVNEEKKYTLTDVHNVPQKNGVGEKKYVLANTNTLKYVHMAAVDENNVASDVTSIPLDVAPPEKVAEFRLNDIDLLRDNQLLTFNEPRLILDCTPATHIRNFEVKYDVELVVAENDLVISSIKDLSFSRNVNLAVNPFKNLNIKPNTLLRIKIKSYTPYGSTLGFAYSKSFKIDLSDPTINIKFDDSMPEFIDARVPRDSYYLGWTTTSTGNEHSQITGYNVYMRTRQNYEANWSEWQLLNSEPITEKRYRLTKAQMDITGYTVREFRVVGRTPSGPTRYFNNPKYASDIAIIWYTGSPRFTLLARLPIMTFDTPDNGPVKFKTIIDSVETFGYPIHVNGNVIKSKIGKKQVGYIMANVPTERDAYTDPVKLKELESYLLSALDSQYLVDGYNGTEPKNYSNVIDPLVTDVWAVVASDNQIDEFLKSGRVRLNFNREAPGKRLKKLTSNTIRSEIFAFEGVRHAFITCGGYEIARYEEIGSPTINVTPKRVLSGETEAIPYYEGPVTVNATNHADVERYQIGRYTRNIFKYVHTFNGDSQTVNYDPNDESSKHLITPGRYTFYAKTRYEDGDDVTESPESTVEFYIQDTSKDYRRPSFYETTYNNGNTVKYVNLNTTNIEETKKRYTYKVEKVVSNNKTDIPFTYEMKNQNACIKFTLAELGVHLIHVTVNDKLSGKTETITEFIEVYRTQAVSTGASIMEGVTKHIRGDRIPSDVNPRYPKYNHVTGRIKNFNPKESIYVYKSNLLNRSFALKPGHNFTILKKTELKFTGLKLAYRDRDKIVRLQGDTEASSTAKNTNAYRRSLVAQADGSNSGLIELEKQSLSVADLDNGTEPPQPQLNITTDNPLSPFSPSGDTDCLAFSPINVRVSNHDATKYQIHFYLNGQKLPEFGDQTNNTNLFGKPSTHSGDYETWASQHKVPTYNVATNTLSPISKAGSHVLTVLFVNRYNYNVSPPKKVKLEVISENVYTPPLITFTPKRQYSLPYTIDIKWFISESEFNVPTTELLNRRWLVRKYKTSIDNVWHDWNPNTPVTIDQPCTVTARKELVSGYTVESSIEIPRWYAVRQEIPSDIGIMELRGHEDDINNHGRFLTPDLSVFTPTVSDNPEYRTTLKINKLGFKPGRPISNFSADIRDYSAELTIEDKYSDKRKVITYPFTLDTTPPKLPNITIAGKKVDSKSSRKVITRSLRTGNNTISYTYDTPPGNHIKTKLIVDGRTITGNTFSLDGTKGSTVHRVIIYVEDTKKHTVNYFARYVEVINDGNSQFQNFSYSKDTDRISIIPYDLDNRNFDTPGELVVDRRTGDLFIVSDKRVSEGTDNYKLVNITGGLKIRLKEIENSIDQVKKTSKMYSDRIRSLELYLPILTKNNADLRLRAETLKREHEVMKAKLQRTMERQVEFDAKGVPGNIDYLKGRYRDEKDAADINRQSVYTGLAQRFNIMRQRLLVDNDKYLELYSKMMINKFNTESVRLQVIDKLSRSEFESIKSRLESHYQQLVRLIRRF